MKKLFFFSTFIFISVFGFSQIATITTVPALQGDSISVCQNTAITFNASTSGGTSPYTYSWDFGDGSTGTGASTTHSYTTGGGYYVTLTSTDNNGNQNTNLARVRIRVSITPIFAGTVSDIYSICVGDMINLTGTEYHPSWSQAIPTTVYAGIFLPDGSGASYQTSITQTQFNAGATITSASDISSICFGLEHSYLGDLNISLACPNGQSVVLKPYPGDSNTFLGEPVDDDNSSTPGNCYEYCFDMNATMGTMVNEAGNYQYSYVDNDGNSYTNHSYLPAGSYQPENSFAGFIGCPLNGDWTVTVTDNLWSDDGYICDWSIHFAPNILPNNLWTFQNTTSSQGWVSGDGLSGSGNPTTATPTTATAPSTSPFVYQITDDFGCSYDTTVNITVNPASSPNCCYQPAITIPAGNETVCGKTYTLQATIESGYNGTWSYTTTSGGTAVISDVNALTTDVVVTDYGDYTFTYYYGTSACNSSQSVTISFLEMPTPFAGNDTSVCGDNINLHGVLSNSANTATWSIQLGSGNFNGSPTTTNLNTNYNNGGNYDMHVVQLTETNAACSGVAIRKVVFNQIPHPNAGVDDTICGNIYTLNGTNNIYNGYWTNSGAMALYSPADTVFGAQASVNITGNYLTTSFIWMENNGTCPGRDTVNITFYRQPSAHADLVAGYSQTTCDTLVELAADTANSYVESGLWFSNPPVDFTTPTEDSTFANTANMNYGANSSRNVVFYFLATNGGCNDIDSINVTFNETPQADAGIDTAICGTIVDLYADFSITNSIGQWYVLNGPGPLDITDNTDPHSIAQAQQYGTYTLEWRENNANTSLCNSSDTVKIKFIEIPVVDAGATIELCGGWAQLNADTSVGKGVWIYPSGIGMSNSNGGTINNNIYDSLYNAWMYNGNQNDTIIMYWRETNVKCVGQDSVKVILWEDQVAQLNMGLQDSVNCGKKYRFLSAIQPNEGVGYWVDSSYTSTQFYPASINAHPDSTIVDYYGNHIFWWVVHNGMCRDTTIGVPVRFIQKPIANAGGIIDTTCGNTYHLHAIPSVGNGRWLNIVNTTFNSTGTTYGTDPSDIVTTSVLSYDYPGEYYNFVWFEETEANCNDRDTIKILFAGQPNAKIDTIIKALCVGDPFQIIAETDPSIDPAHPTIFNWDMDNGIIDTSGNIPNTYNIYNPIVIWNDGQTEHSVELISENIYGCKSPIKTINLKEPPALTPTLDQEAATCGQSNGIGYLLTDNGDYSFSWVDTTTLGAWMFPDPYNSSLPSSDTIQQNLPPGTYLIAVRGEQKADSTIPSGHFCYDTIQFVIADTGYIEALIDTPIEDGIAPYTVNVINTTQDGNKFYWYVYTQNDSLIQTSVDQNPQFTFDNEGEYWIKYIAISKDGCSDTLNYKYIKVDAESLLEIPNIFTPNGDGINDEFKVHYKTLANFNGVIINRWGRKVFEWTNPDKGWNGKIDGNKADAATGVYFYIIKATGQDEKTYEFKGAFHLVRTK